MADPVTNAIAMLDGRDPDKPGRPTLPWRLTKLYRRVSVPFTKPLRQTGGSDGANTPGAEWNTPSTLDEVTVLAEIFTKVYVDGKGVEHNMGDMLIELYQKLVEGK